MAPYQFITRKQIKNYHEAMDTKDKTLMNLIFLWIQLSSIVSKKLPVAIYFGAFILPWRHYGKLSLSSPQTGLPAYSESVTVRGDLLTATLFFIYNKKEMSFKTFGANDSTEQL